MLTRKQAKARVQLALTLDGEWDRIDDTVFKLAENDIWAFLDKHPQATRMYQIFEEADYEWHDLAFLQRQLKRKPKWLEPVLKQLEIIVIMLETEKEYDEKSY